MMFGKARLVFAGQDEKNREQAVKRMREVPNGYLVAAFTDYKDAVLYAQNVGCDAVFFDCDHREGEYLQKELYTTDKDIIVSFRDKFYMDAFGWCNHIGEYEDSFQSVSSACWYDPYDLPETFGYREIWSSIDKMADERTLYNDLPDEIKQHCERVADMTVSAMVYAEKNRLLEDTEYTFDLHTGYMDYLYEAALLHDVGKAFLPVWLLEKKAPFTRAERTLYHMHVQFGDRLLTAYELPLMIDDNLSGEILRRYMAQSCAAYHHEFIGSSPLQNGHDTEDTPIWAQVCGIVNLWDCLLFEGLDGKIYTEAEAKDWLENKSCGLFTPEAYEIFKGYQQSNA